MFVTLTSTVTGLPVYVNVNHIVVVLKNDDRGFCVLYMSGGYEVTVKESASTVAKLADKEEAQYRT